ncbi:AAA family ATPase [Chromatiales bacterium (ex Bugula neritina AB1)]|nr:AAA family ATPase [Chromatiales bacterium (ex Bugula neritina AB1)]
MSVFEKITAVQQQLRASIIGQERLVDRLLIALLADGHLLVEGAPGLAKTRAIKELARHISGDFQRIQFTPDLLPADITGTEIYLPATGEFQFQHGPLFNQIILADEINRAPAKVQSALLEAMAERQISVGQKTWPLSELFLVMATQNPIEQEGTYSLPEAQLDRFLMHVMIDYPVASREIDILRLVRRENDRLAQREPVLPPAVQLSVGDIVAARSEIARVYVAESVEEYLVRLVTSTRGGNLRDDSITPWISFGASPRGTIALDACARAHAWLLGQDYVSPADIQAVIHDTLRHRVLLSYEAEAEGVTVDSVIDHLLARVAVP